MSFSILEGKVLDMVAAGKSPRQIAVALGIDPTEAVRMAYDLLDREIVTDVQQSRKLQIYRLNKMIEPLWARIDAGDADDFKNLTGIVNKLAELQGLDQKHDEEREERMFAYQLAVYSQALSALVKAFQALAPNALENEEAWAEWTAEVLQESQKELTGGQH